MTRPRLNEQQRKAASFGNGVASVLAIPGSGKTLTMTHRIGNLVRNHGVAPENILGLTFTRNPCDAPAVLKVVCNAPAVTGKSDEHVGPTA